MATPGSIPYATTQFQQVDVGVNIDLEPHVNGADEVSMKIKVEISNTAGNVTIAGISEPIITQRVNEANIRMKDGEVSVLGGLSDVEDNNTISGVPGITNIPVLGYLFGTKQRVKSDDEILVALVPHIVRAPDLSALGEEGVLAGTERVVHVQRKVDGAVDDGSAPAGQPNTAPQTPTTTPNPPARPGPGATAGPYNQPAAPTPNQGAGAGATQTPQP